MPSFILLLLILLVFASAFGFMIYSDLKRRAREKKRNQYHDRVWGALSSEETMFDTANAFITQMRAICQQEKGHETTGREKPFHW